MDVPPEVLAVIITAGVGLTGTWLARRSETRNARIKANSDIVSVTASLEVDKEKLLSNAISSHFDRLDQQIKNANQRIAHLEQERQADHERISGLISRVEQLEEERGRMIVWMAQNRLAWPPPDEA